MEENEEKEFHINKKLMFKPSSCPNHPSVKMSHPKAIVVHYVGCAGQAPEDVCKYFSDKAHGKGKDAHHQSSAHFVVGIKGDIFQILPKDVQAIHAGGGKGLTSKALSFGHPNTCTFGIEMCHPTPDKFSDETIQSTVKLIVYLIRKLVLIIL